MKPSRIHWLTGALLFGLTGLACAQNPIDTPSERRHFGHTHRMHSESGDHQARRLGALKSKLNLASSQESNWTAFVQSMQPVGRTTTPPDRSALQQMTTPERIDHLQALQAVRDARAQKRWDATKTFYATLSADQKKIFDAETAHFMRARGHRMGHEGEHHRHH